MQFLNQYSYVFVSLFALLICAAIAFLWLPLPAGIAFVALVGGLLVTVAIRLRTRASVLADAAGPDELIGAGRPVLVAVFSNY